MKPQTAAIIAYHKEHPAKTRGEIAAVFGVTKNTLISICNRYGLDPPRGEAGGTRDWDAEKRAHHAQRLQEYWAARGGRPKKPKAEKRPSDTIHLFNFAGRRHNARSLIRMALHQPAAQKPVTLPPVQWLERKTTYG